MFPEKVVTYIFLENITSRKLLPEGASLRAQFKSNHILVASIAARVTNKVLCLRLDESVDPRFTMHCLALRFRVSVFLCFVSMYTRLCLQLIIETANTFF